jgi:hypothetical protein
MNPPVIGFWGGMALLVSSITGPGLTTSLHLQLIPNYYSHADQLAVPLLFQQAGWFTYEHIPIALV